MKKLVISAILSATFISHSLQAREELKGLRIRDKVGITKLQKRGMISSAEAKAIETLVRNEQQWGLGKTLLAVPTLVCSFAYPVLGTAIGGFLGAAGFDYFNPEPTDLRAAANYVADSAAEFEYGLDSTIVRFAPSLVHDLMDKWHDYNFMGKIGQYADFILTNRDLPTESNAQRINDSFPGNRDVKRGRHVIAGAAAGLTLGVLEQGNTLRNFARPIVVVDLLASEGDTPRDAVLAN